MPREDKHDIDDPMIKTILNGMGKVLATSLPKTHGFTLLIYSFGEGGDLFYISNAVREDMIKSMQEMITKLQG